MNVSLPLLLAACGLVAAAGRADSPAPSPAPASLSTITPMTEDKRIKADDLDAVMKHPKIFFLDVREPKEIEEHGSFEGYVNIPMSQLESRLSELPKDRPILTA
jgi:hypothetical protein